METYTFFGDEMDVRKTSMAKNSIYVTYYTFWSKIVLMEAIPYGVIFFLNIIIVSKIFESIQFRKKFRTNKPRDDVGNYPNNTTQTPPLGAERRRQSSPALKHLRVGDHRNSIDFLSSSNLRGHDGSGFQINKLGNRRRSSSPSKVHII